MKKFSVLMIVALLLISVLVACAPSKQVPASSDIPASTAAPAATPSESAPAASFAPTPTASDSSDAQPFCKDDFILGGLKAGSTGEDATKLFGKPTEVFSYEEEATGNTLETWSYDFGELTFQKDNGKLLFTGGSVIDGSLTGPRGTKVGDTFEQVKALFPHAGTKVIGDANVLYSANYDDNASNIILPPRGYYDNEEGILYYDTPVTPYGEAVTKEIESYVYDSHYSCSFEFDTEDGSLTRITLFNGAFAE